jgi:predicted dehydrogenase
VVYAEMDDGPIPFENFGTWKSVSGAPWPAKDEFEVGCTLEHAGYCLTWLTAFFGPARSITSFAHSLLPDKGIPLDRITPDFTVGSIEFVSGVVARLTCGIFAAPDRSLRIFGDGGILSTRDSWNSASPVYHSRRNHLGLKAEKHPVLAKWVGLGPGRVPLVRRPNFRWAGRPANYIDFARGVAEVAASAREKRPARLSARWSLHVNELALTLQDPATYGAHRLLKSTFEPMQPMPWSD